MNILEAVHTCLTQAESERAAATVRTYRNGLNYDLAAQPFRRILILDWAEEE